MDNLIAHWDGYLGLAYVFFSYVFFWTKRHDEKFWKQFHKDTADYGI